MSNGELPLDDNNKPSVGLWDSAGHQVVPAQAVSVATDSSGQKYGVMNVNASFSASSLAINDPNTPAQKAGVNAGGSLQVAGQGTAGTAAGGVVSIQGVAGGTAIPTQDIEQPGYVAATAPPTTTNAGSDTPYTFSAQVSRVIVQNNTSVNVNYAFDTTSTLGSLLLLPGAFLNYPKKVTVLHLFTAAAQNINGSTGSNIVVLGAI